MTTKLKLATLYKQTSTGKVQQWHISVDDNKVTTVYGLVGGKLQTTVDIVKEGKNLGRSNATTPETQATAEAQQSYDGKLKEGYVTDIKLAGSTKNTLDAVEPMLAHPIENKEKYVTFPAWSQPKFDGLRCIAIIKNGKATLYSRTQKEYITVPHINVELEKIFSSYSGADLVLDGELYNHKFKKDFNKITSLIKREDVHPDHELVQYHIYDVVSSESYSKRVSILWTPLKEAKYCFSVETKEVKSRDELEEYQAECVERGYEGCMYRSKAGGYEHKRSATLLKVKNFIDAEFLIVGVEEGSGKLMDRVGAFYFELGDGKRFKAKPACTLEQSKEYWDNRKACIGKWATVKYQNLTPDGVPRFPVMKCIRDYE